MVWRKIDGTDYQFDYDGYEYRTWIDDDGDVRKIFHECYLGEYEITMPSAFYNYTPYQYMRIDEFKSFIDELKENE